jgi:hypothetical protein
LLTEAGFQDVSVEITRRYTIAEAGLDTAALSAGWEADGKLAGAFIRATKPLSAGASRTPAQEAAREQPAAAPGACCGGSCCS